MYLILTASTIVMQVTEYYGYTLFAAYHIVAIIVLINMLIAMMARSYEVIAVRAPHRYQSISVRRVLPQH